MTRELGISRAAAMVVVVAGSLFATRTAIAADSDETAVKAVLASYSKALQNLDASAARDLFTADSEIIESGGVEGTFERYLEHHIGPELEEFRSFAITDHQVAVEVAGDFALATETFRYRIEPKEGQTVERLGTVSSVLRRVGNSWKIYRYHWSSRKPPSPKP